ncbi:Ubiquitin-conjugating enzyme E2 S [Capsicum baccatum]|uniref:Ubiquitin-conjugating enzyme E2 S n=1 Tax=Capsicum baccatum TaxID=33114 RepID=A0A2G2XQ44_CAPBA|nr:Ubiquitin-conjugating enzyme E2 S [Capsicum baccatum]
MLIALAAVYDLQIHQMDVKTALLNGDLEEEIYMEQREGFVVLEKENKVLDKFKYMEFGIAKTPLDASFAIRKNEDYVKSKDNVSDPLTKGLSKEGVERTSKGIGLRPRTIQHGAGTPYVNGVFRMKLIFTHDFPHFPPKGVQNKGDHEERSD